MPCVLDLLEALAKVLAAFAHRVRAELDERVQREFLHAGSLNEARCEGEISGARSASVAARFSTKLGPALDARSSNLHPVTRVERVWWCLWLVSLAACGAVQRPDGGRGLLEAGATVSALQGQDQHGNRVRLGFPTAKPTVVYFYPKDATPGCTKEACAFRDVWRRYRDRGIEVIGVSGDDQASHVEFSKAYQLPFPLIADENGDWGRAFGVPSVAGFYSRVTFLVGQDGRVLKTYEDVDPGIHANQILDDVDRLSPAASTSFPSSTSGNDALLAPAPRAAPPAPPTVGLRLHLGVSPSADAPTELWIAAELRPPSGAHLSWKYVDGAGLPTVVEFFAPRGYSVDMPRYPAPTRYATATGRTALGYTGSMVVLARVTQNTDASPPDVNRPETYVPFQMHGTWLSCDTRCTKEEVHQTVKWNGSASPLPELPRWLSALPNPAPPVGMGARLLSKNKTIELSSPTDWQLEDAFMEANVLPGATLPAFTRDAAGRWSLIPITQPAPARVVVKARSAGTAARHFLLSVTGE